MIPFDNLSRSIGRKLRCVCVRYELRQQCERRSWERNEEKTAAPIVWKLLNSFCSMLHYELTFGAQSHRARDSVNNLIRTATSQRALNPNYLELKASGDNFCLKIERYFWSSVSFIIGKFHSDSLTSILIARVKWFRPERNDFLAVVTIRLVFAWASVEVSSVKLCYLQKLISWKSTWITPTREIIINASVFFGIIIFPHSPRRLPCTEPRRRRESGNCVERNKISISWMW